MFIASMHITCIVRMNTIKQINNSSNKQHLPLLSLTLTRNFQLLSLTLPLIIAKLTLTLPNVLP